MSKELLLPTELKEALDQQSGPRHIRVFGGTRHAFRPQKRPGLSLLTLINEAKTEAELNQLIEISQRPHIKASDKTQRRWKSAIMAAWMRLTP